MNHSASIRIGCLLFLLIASACSKPAQNQQASNTPSSALQRIRSESVVNVSAQPVAITRGESGDAVVLLTIQAGYHTNANPPTFPYLIATQLDITAGDGISVAFVSYPNALTKKFAFADEPLAVYEGKTELRAKLKADTSAPKGEHSVAAQLRVQACDDQVCYPPGQIELRIPVTVK
ncbi:MAG: protein-disulfide reductase DsbD domain-containing protein [bacterium]